MKKPLIILVDDDRAILEALETTLDPLFGEICRIEAFVDPGETLEATARWAEEGRPLALAIVDQKMPGMTGTELLKRLRATCSCSLSLSLSGFKAVMLTGYAGLDSAIEGKNEAGVDRYIEKPWGRAVLVETCAELLARYLEETGLATHYVFREVVEDQEVYTHLVLRFETYRSAPSMAHILEMQRAFAGPIHIDLDNYDEVSRFFSLFACHNTMQMVGTLRIISQDRGPAAHVVDALAHKHSSLLTRYAQPRDIGLPMLTYLIDCDEILSLYAQLTKRGERVVEVGRFTVAPAYSGIGRQLAKQITEGAIGAFFLWEIEHCLIDVVPAHVAFYVGYGFRPLGTYRHSGGAMTVLHGTLAGTPSPARERTMSMGRRMARTGSACRCATFPACMPGPYETGDFRNVDLFCPLRAREILDGTGRRQ